ncbi:hypothetical protein VTN77DRAFT_1701 [Rasamsonia byssochlamydoides]|uniref:uncharacterized protein n=1 Tax=Rasamsonia byssochlamydoides TaxID=89139 RepID=UPI00374395F9
MSGSMQASSDPVAISNPLPATSSSILSGPSDQISFLKTSQPKSESHLSSIASAGLRTSPSPGIEGPRPSSSPRMTSTTTAGPVDRPSEQEKDREQQQQQSSPQVAREALGAAIGVSTDKDQKSQDHANAANTLSEPMDTVARSIQMSSDEMQVDPQRSPGPVADTFGAGDHATTSGTLINSSTVASPGPIEETASQDGDRSRHQNEPPEVSEDANKAFSYPMPTASMNDPRRGLSLPNSGFHKGSPRSPSTKKHRCPYCSTEFTRHHNLKSHLLTHSQEKPYVCQTCQSRFRRLHDLKRHTKLHTGERPHICPKCGRRFARGDALARHNKGQGGCAGRRASMGSYVAEDEYGEVGPGGGEDAMDGLMYTEPERMDEEDERRLNMPSIRKPNAPSTEPVPRGASGVFHSRGPSTYPPLAATRPPPSGGLFPPATSHGGSSSSTSPISQTGAMTFPPAGHPSSASFSAPNMTDSPKPLSPNALASNQLGHGPEGGNIHLHQQHRPHSPSLNQQYSQQQHYSRAGPAPPSASTAQAPLGLPPPQPGAPQLPPPPGLNPPDARYTLHTQGPVQAPPPSTLPAKHAATHSHSSSHGATAAPQTGGESGQTGPLSGSQDPNGTAEQSQEDKLWAYIRSVHEELRVLRTEVVALRAQIAATQNPGQSSTVAPPQQASGEGNSGNGGTR